MAIYEVRQNQLVKVAATLEDYLGCDRISDYHSFLEQQGFSLAEEEGRSFVTLARAVSTMPNAVLPDVRFIFDVYLGDDTVEYIMVGDDLDAYLAVLAKLEPMVARDLRATEAIQRGLSAQR